MDAKQKLAINGVQIPPREMWRYTLRWYLDNGGCVPVLYSEGKRVTWPWQFAADIDMPADSSGGNANTA